ncbi:cell division protein ZapC [Shewanella gelidii]|uniref:Cell division protein ZapC n=1 Tax=Shewanella gelidii TaxID=1642821 RepID=A0A917JV45_9GAMM|nr:cell division protein ZapC [Shewanella gelidii]MCL1099043.1 cell division protein ZapC [Shewanella gelidii]GGI88604.1 cell division protein ZapC [Shewanella gelidii]
MILMPQKDWQWNFSLTHQVLSVSLGSDYEFLTPYTSKLLIPDARDSLEFSVEHAKFYIDLLDKLSTSLSVTDGAIVQIALNATAAHFLIKPQMPKSWFFDASDTCVYSEVGKVFYIKANGHKSLVVAVEVGLQATQVMLLSSECQLTDSKCLKQFDTIKVMHDRLHPLRVNRQVVAA